MRINECTKPNAPTDPDMGQNFSPELECPDRLIMHKQNGRIISVDCNDTCPHHEDYYKKEKKLEIIEIKLVGSTVPIGHVIT